MKANFAQKVLTSAFLASGFVSGANGQINFRFRDNSSCSSIKVDGREILVGGGIYFIASGTGEDIPEQAVATGGNTDGLMRNPEGLIEPLPFSLDFDQINESSLRFRATFGPAPRDYNTLALAMDFNQTLFTHFNSNVQDFEIGAPSSRDVVRKVGGGGRYEKIPQNFPLDIEGADLAVGVANAWRATKGEIVGSNLVVSFDLMEFTKNGKSKIWHPVTNDIRRRKSNVINFTNHPGTHNIGSSLGGIKTGETITFTGKVSIKKVRPRGAEKRVGRGSAVFASSAFNNWLPKKELVLDGPAGYPEHNMSFHTQRELGSFVMLSFRSPKQLSKIEIENTPWEPQRLKDALVQVSPDGASWMTLKKIGGVKNSYTIKEQDIPNYRVKFMRIIHSREEYLHLKHIYPYAR